MKDENIKNLEKIIKEASDAYYNSEQIMSDAEFDDYMNKLKRLDPDNELVVGLGTDSGSSFNKVNHLMYMGSQQKATSVEEFEDWVRKYPRKEYIVEYKCDGSSIELQYKDGKFFKAVTRGNGNIGDDVTDNILKARGLITELADTSFTGSVRGEVLIFHKVFEAYCKDKANCRNAANGIMKRKNSENADLLNIVVYDAFCTSNPDCFKTEYDKIEWLKKMGFKVVDVFYMNKVSDITQFRDSLSTDRFEDIEYDIDGLVIKCPEVDKEDASRVRPNKQIAFKFILNEQPTTIRDVEWYTNGRTRTPVAVCDPVYLCGTTVRKANLCNINLITTMGLKIGSKVMMVKRGEMIPKIERVISTPVNAKDIQIPTKCEYCYTPLVVTSTSVYCPSPTCPKTRVRRLIKWASVNKIYGLGESLCEALYAEGIVQDVKDFYTHKVEDLSKVMSPKVAAKIIENIKKTNTITLPKFIAGYDMFGLGETIVEKLEDHFKPQSLEEFLNLKASDIANVEGFGETIGQQIANEFKIAKNELLELNKYVKIKLGKTIKIGKLAGKTFCFTGPMNSMTRDKAIELVKESGGRVTSSVTKETDYLVSNETSNSSKYLAAKKLGVKIINEAEFVEMYNN